MRTWATSIDEGYLQAMGIPLLAGRDFRATDTPERPRVAIVNDTLARHCWPKRSAIGQRFQIVDGVRPAWIEVIGLVKTTETFYPGEPPQELAYFPFRQEPRGTMILLAATTADSASVLVPLRNMLWRIDADVPVYDMQTIETFLDAWFAGIAQSMLGMIGGMGIMGVALTTVGL